MGVLINHAISFLTSPLAVSLALAIFGLAAALRSSRKWKAAGVAAAGLGLGWLYLMSSGLMILVLGLGLEREFPPAPVESLPSADAIVLLGGGVGANTNTVRYTELYAAADRVAHAARIWRAGKAPRVIPSGSGELQASRPLLLEWGVPESAIVVENHSRNTEENARFAAAFVKAHRTQSPPRILLVTSAWHMRRALLLFRKYVPDVEVVPAACDYEATIDSDRFNPNLFLPSADALFKNSYALKEYIGYWGYRLLRF